MYIIQFGGIGRRLVRSKVWQNGWAVIGWPWIRRFGLRFGVGGARTVSSVEMALPVHKIDP